MRSTNWEPVAPYVIERMAHSAIVAGVGDLHTCTTTGLMPPVARLDSGGAYTYSDDQAWIWSSWLAYWDKIYREKQRTGDPVVAFLDGETADINSHSTVEQAASNESTAIAIAVAALEPALDVADVVFVLRGTEAHTGKLSSLDELVAQRIGAAPDKRLGTYSWRNLYTLIAGVTFDVSHHPGHGHMRPWTRGGGANRLAISIVSAYHDAGETPPAVTLRGHNHRYEDSGKNFATFAVINHAWKMTDSYGYRLGAGRHALPIGGQIFYCNDGRFLHDDYRFCQPGADLGYWTPAELTLAAV